MMMMKLPILPCAEKLACMTWLTYASWLQVKRFKPQTIFVHSAPSRVAASIFSGFMHLKIDVVHISFFGLHCSSVDTFSVTLRCTLWALFGNDVIASFIISGNKRLEIIVV